MPAPWSNQIGLHPRAYDCGHCGTHVTGQVGFVRDNTEGGVSGQDYLYICPCGKPTYFPIRGGQIPGALSGHPVKSLPADIEALWQEIRRGSSAGVYSLVVMGCRKMLMHVAVEKGAGKDLKFVQYVEWLDANGYVPPGGKKWVDYIRTKGNETTHAIVLSKREDAEKLITFCGMLLRLVYEFPLEVP